ncbi:MAG: hypothetical protein Q9M94_05195 [Candidatus Gracilibacteria bacterium]|nr:hypothetical protein [Candidatus Gracilibacteria bacterium]
MSKVIKTNLFINNVNKLFKKYIKIKDDLSLFNSNFELESFSDLGKGFRKYRIKNSSIPTGKSGGFRLIIKELNGNIIPIVIYSKTNRKNIGIGEIEQSYLLILNELKQG